MSQDYEAMYEDMRTQRNELLNYISQIENETSDVKVAHIINEVSSKWKRPILTEKSALLRAYESLDPKEDTFEQDLRDAANHLRDEVKAFEEENKLPRYVIDSDPSDHDDIQIIDTTKKRHMNDGYYVRRFITTRNYEQNQLKAVALVQALNACEHPNILLSMLK